MSILSGLDPIKMIEGKFEAIEKKLEAIDIDHNGIPDYQEIKAEVAKDLPLVQSVAAKVTPERIVEIYNHFETDPAKQITVAEITAAEAAAGRVVTQLEKLPAIVAAAKAEIGIK